VVVTDVPLSRPVVRLGAVGPVDAVEAIRALLGAAAPTSLAIVPQMGEETLDTILLIVTAEEGVTDAIREQLRNQLQPDHDQPDHEKRPAPVVAFLDGCDRVPEGQGFILDLIELDLRGTLSDLGLPGESLPVIRGSARQALAPEPAEEWTAPIRALVSALTAGLTAALTSIPAAGAAPGFRMSIGDVVPTRRGAVVLGRIESGRVHPGADVEIVHPGQAGRTARVRGVMRAWDLVPDGREGEDVGLFLEKIRLTDFLGVRRLVQPAAPPVPAEAADAGYFAVPVFYATDRNRTEEPAPRLVYGGERGGELAFGVAEVSLPRSRRRAGLPAPPWWRLEFAEDLARHIVLLDVAERGREPFLAELRRTVRRADPPEVLVFVHGYDVTFEDAARHAAQLADALDFPAVPFLYSWPSEGKAHRYTVDEANVEWARVHAAEILRLVLAASGARAVHVIAHGMGSRALAWALGDLEPQNAGKAALRQVVFAAPDIDRETFLGLVPRMRDRAEHLTLYGSSNDRALRAARIVHSRPRAGESGGAMAVAEGIESIDAGAADTSLRERSGPTILTAVAALLRRGLPA
jgi:esterase/lipase superfamily enzyme